MPELQKATEMLEHIIGKPVFCTAASGLRCTDTVLLEKETMHFSYNSDCRGYSTFFPVVARVQLNQPQIPVTLPTYDEIIGSNGITSTNYNEHLLSLIKANQLNVLTIHAEAEGISCMELFQDFLIHARRQEICFAPLKEFLSGDNAPQPAAGWRASTFYPG